MDEVESLERATFAAVPPQALESLDGWLLGLDDGTVGRAHSAVPTRHQRANAAVLDEVMARYARRGLAAVFRVPRLPAFDSVRAALAGRGYAGGKPTLTMTGDLEAMAAMASAAQVELLAAPDPRWEAVFLGEGFDPQEAAGRLAILRRARDNVFAAAVLEGQVAAVGTGCYAEGWCGIHGMRTAPAWRGRGLASAVLAALAHEARLRGIGRAFLQVEEGNETAQRLYRRAGLRVAWGYEYWRPR
jgi:ribosomal protein S18 acetylase RimI-like enzyme